MQWFDEFSEIPELLERVPGGQPITPHPQQAGVTEQNVKGWARVTRFHPFPFSVLSFTAPRTPHAAPRTPHPALLRCAPRRRL